MNKDFHIEIIKAINEPEEAKWDYLDNLRKETKLSKAGFIAKLKEANNNIYRAWKALEMDIKSKLPEIQNLSFPYNSFMHLPHLKNFSTQFHGHINEQHLKTLENFIRIYELRTLQKEYLKMAKKAESGKETDKKETSESKQESKSNPLESIWMKNPSMTINEFLEKGQDLGLWDEEFKLIAMRGGPYGSGKALLANISIVLKGHSINDGIDHKKIGEVFCSFFKIGIKPETNNQFKQFQSGNANQIQELKKRLK